MLPPKVKKRRLTKSRGPKPQPQWDDGFAVSRGIPEYKAYNDSYAQGYMGKLKQNGGYNKYMREAALRPGGIRPVKQKIGQTEYNNRMRPNKLESLSHNSSQSHKKEPLMGVSPNKFVK
jgi:hypothetical protein